MWQRWQEIRFLSPNRLLFIQFRKKMVYVAIDMQHSAISIDFEASLKIPYKVQLVLVHVAMDPFICLLHNMF